MASRRYLLADGVERWTASRRRLWSPRSATLPPDLTVVLVARELSPKAKAPKGLAKAVEGAGGEVLSYAAPKARDLPARLAEDAAGAASGSSPLRRACWSSGWGRARCGSPTSSTGSRSGRARTGRSRSTTSRRWSPTPPRRPPGRSPTRSSPAIRRGAARRGAALAAQGEAVTPLIYQAARRLARRTTRAGALEAGTPQEEVESSAHDASVRGEDADPAAARTHPPRHLRAATCAIADLEWWTRGGSEYPDDVALTLAVRRAAGAGAGAS